MSHIRVKPLALIALITTCWAQAAELGNMEINSGIDQKLNADIPLNLGPNENTANTRVKIISSKDRNDNTDNSADPNFEINSDDGRLKLTSKQAIHSPRIDLVLEVKTDKDTQYKQFSIDLNRASENSPLIVTPQNKVDKSQATAQPIKKYYRKKNQTTALPASNSTQTYPIKVDSWTEQKPIENSSHVNPVTPNASSIDDNHQTLAVEPIVVNSIAQQPNIVAVAPQPTLVAEPQTKPDWIQENAFTLIAFLTGILGVLFLQKLLSREAKIIKSPRQTMSGTHDQHQILQDSLAREIEPQTENLETPNIASDVALFEQLLHSRMQQLKQSEPLEADHLTVTANSQHIDLEDDEFGFDFDLPDFSMDQSKAK